MKTYYKPTEWRGKRVVFQSIDPAERKKQTRVMWIVFSVILILFIFGLLVS